MDTVNYRRCFHCKGRMEEKQYCCLNPECVCGRCGDPGSKNSCYWCNLADKQSLDDSKSFSDQPPQPEICSYRRCLHCQSRMEENQFRCLKCICDWCGNNCRNGFCDVCNNFINPNPDLARLYARLEQKSALYNEPSIPNPSPVREMEHVSEPEVTPEPITDNSSIYQLLCIWCSGPEYGGNCPACSDGKSGTEFHHNPEYEPTNFPNQPLYHEPDSYSCEYCGGPHQGFQCQVQYNNSTFGYEPYPYSSQQSYCCEYCGGPHVNSDCQNPIAYEQVPCNTYDYAYNPPPQYQEIQHPLDNPKIYQGFLNILQELNKLKESLQEPVQERDPNQKTYGELLAEEQAAKISYRRPFVYDSDSDDDYTPPSGNPTPVSEPCISDSSPSLTPVERSDVLMEEVDDHIVSDIVEPVDSFIMGDEPLSTIPETEETSDEILIPIPRESGVVDICDEPSLDNLNDSVEMFSDSDDDSYGDIDFIDNLPSEPDIEEDHDFEPEEEEIEPEDIEIEDPALRETLSHVYLLISKIEALNNNSSSHPISAKDSDFSPELETFRFDEDIGGNPTIDDVYLPILEKFYFDIDESKDLNDISDTPTNDPIIEDAIDDPIPPGIEDVVMDDPEGDIVIVDGSLDSPSSDESTIMYPVEPACEDKIFKPGILDKDKLYAKTIVCDKDPHLDAFICEPTPLIFSHELPSLLEFSHFDPSFIRPPAKPPDDGSFFHTPFVLEPDTFFTTQPTQSHSLGNEDTVFDPGISTTFFPKDK